jgi:CheY-like chemotaxis protein
MQVELKNSGLGAIEAIKSKKFDLVFMDHMMPEMDGVEATAAIRALEGEHFKTLPVIALTANVVLGLKEMLIERGFNDFLAKPIDISKLDETLDRWIPKEKREWDIEKKDRRSKNRKNDSDVSLQPLVIPGVNVQYGITMTGGTLTLYRQVLALFRKDAEKRLPMFQTMPDAETLSSFVTQVHALKSASASLGAAEISALAAELETAGKAGDLAFIRKNLSGFTRQLAELVEGIRAWETSIKESDSSEDGANPAAALPLLRELASALEAQKTDDIDRILEELNQRPPDPKIREALEQISEQVLVSEFDEAGKIVHSILEGG